MKFTLKYPNFYWNGEGRKLPTPVLVAFDLHRFNRNYEISQPIGIIFGWYTCSGIFLRRRENVNKSVISTWSNSQYQCWSLGLVLGVRSPENGTQIAAPKIVCIHRSSLKDRTGSEHYLVIDFFKKSHMYVTQFITKSCPLINLSSYNTTSSLSSSCHNFMTIRPYLKICLFAVTRLERFKLFVDR